MCDLRFLSYKRFKIIIPTWPNFNLQDTATLPPPSRKFHSENHLDSCPRYPSLAFNGNLLKHQTCMAAHRSALNFICINIWYLESRTEQHEVSSFVNQKGGSRRLTDWTEVHVILLISLLPIGSQHAAKCCAPIGQEKGSRGLFRARLKVAALLRSHWSRERFSHSTLG